MVKVKYESKFKFKERHILYNWQESPEDKNLVRYHFVIVDDRFLEQKPAMIIENFNKNNFYNMKYKFIKNWSDFIINETLKTTDIDFVIKNVNDEINL